MRGPSEHSPGARDPLYESLLWCLGGLGQLLQPWTFDFSSDLLTYLRDAERTGDFCKALWGAEVLSRLSVLTAFMQLSWVLSLSWESQPPAGQQERLVYTELCQWFLKRHTVTSREVWTHNIKRILRCEATFCWGFKNGGRMINTVLVSVWVRGKLS